MHIFKGLLYQRAMQVFTRKILASIGLLIAIAGWPLLGFCQSTYTLVTSADDLTAGAKYIIVGEKNGAYKAMGYQNDNNRNAVEISVSNKTVTAICATIKKDTEKIYEFTLGGNNTNGWTFLDGTLNQYLYAASSSNNYLRSQGNINDNALWSITIDNNDYCSIIAKGTNTRNIIRYNSTSSLFSCYSSTSGNPVSLYKKSEEPTIDETPPTFTTGYPKTDNVTKNGFDLKVKASEPCTVFYKVVAEGGTAPTKGELLASDKTIAVETGNAEYTATISELEPETTYNVYLIAKDTADNVQNDSTIVSATTLSAVQKIITLGEISDKYYWGETARITWTATNFTASTDNDYIILSKDNTQILSQKISITDGEADIQFGNTLCDEDTYGTDYKLKIISGEIESESGNFTIVPTITIRQLVIDTTNKGESVFKNDIVRVKGLVTGTKSSSFTIQDGTGDFCATYVTNNSNTEIAIGDSVYTEGIVGTTTNMIKIGSSSTTIVTRINSGHELPTPRIVSIPEIIVNKGLTNVIVTVKNVINKNKIFYNGRDSIIYANTLFSNTNNYLKEGRKYDITGAVGIDSKKRKEIWPRSEVPTDFYIYSNDTTLAGLTIGGQNGLNADTLYFKDLATPKRISVATTDNKATATVMVNDNVIDTADLQLFNPLDSVFVTVRAEDESEHRYKVVIDQFTVQSTFCTIGQIKHNNSNSNPYIGKFVTTNGTVTFANSTAKNTELYIQDSTGMWSGIMVIDTDNKFAGNTKIGDKIQVTGRVTELPNSIRIEELESLTITQSGGKVITDTIIAEDAISVSFQDAIVTIDSVVCTGGFENLFAVSDSTNSILIYNKYRISDFALEIDSMYRITGIVYYTSADNSYRIIPRSADDIVKLVRPLKPEQTKPEEQKPEEQKPQEPDTTTVGISGTHIGLTAYTIGRTIVVENADATVTVFDIAGRLIATARPARRIAISAPHSGIYIVGTRQGAIKVRVD